MTDDMQKIVLEWVDKFVHDPTCRVVHTCSTVDTTELTDTWRSFKASDTKYLLLAIGPERQPTENTVNELLSGDAGFEARYYTGDDQ